VNLSAGVTLASTGTSSLFIELGAVLLVLAALGRIAARLGLPAIPLYLLAGLLLGQGSAFPLDASINYIRSSANIGVILLLLLLGIEYSHVELRTGLVTGWPAGLVDLVTNAAPGFVAGLVLGWGVVAAVVLAGVTYVSSSGIIASQIMELERMGNRETPTVLSILVFEDLVMAVFLPVIGVLLVGGTAGEAVVSIAVAVGVVAAAMLTASKIERHVNRALDASSPDLLILGILGLTLLLGGLAEEVNVSAAIAAFLIGVTIADRVAERGNELLAPIRDVFAGLFFVYFGLQIDPSTLPPMLLPALALTIVGVAGKTATGWWAARRAGVGPRARLRAGLSLIPRGEFSIVIAGLATAAGVDDRFGPLAAAYVLFLAIVGSVAMRYADRIPLRSPAPAGTR